MTVQPHETLAHLRLRQQAVEAAAARRARAIRGRLPHAVACLRAFGATQVVLFGSFARGDVRADSDVDLAVRGVPVGDHIPAMAAVARSLGCRVDLVRLETAPPALLAAIRSDGVEL